MTRAGNLFDLILTRENFRSAWLKSIRGKSDRPEVLKFRENLDSNLDELCSTLAQERFTFGDYRTFTIHDPKERMICAASFPERVVHHAIMNVLDPVFERCQIADSYACRRGKGTLAAVLRAFHCIKNKDWFLKLDVRKYFDSIDHGILKRMLLGKIKDRAVLDVLDLIIDSYSTLPGKGLPIGNLTSQYFANHYLAALDHEVTDRLRIGPWIRYMDDMLCLCDSKDRLSVLYEDLADFAGGRLSLELKPKILDRSDCGAPFLGFLIKPSGIFLARKSKVRFRKRYHALWHGFGQGLMSEIDFSARSSSLCAHTEIARSRSFRQNVIHGRVLWRQPRESRRQLEQRCRELPVGQSEQQPGQQEQ